jgi:hypothetical protein
MLGDDMFARAVGMIREAMTEPDALKRGQLLQRAVELAQLAYDLVKAAHTASDDDLHEGASVVE